MRSICVLTTGLLIVAITIGCTGVERSDRAGRTVRSYHIGNSLTAQFLRCFPQTDFAPNGPAIELISDQLDLDWQYGYDLIAGAPLHWHWSHPQDGNTHGGFGQFPEALPGHDWDFITLQPHNSRLGLEGEEGGDVTVASRMVGMALENPRNRDMRVYIYSSWVKRPKQRNEEGDIVRVEPVDFEKEWLAQNDPPKIFTRQYFEALVDALNSTDELQELVHPVRLIPVGDVLLALDRRLRDGAMEDLDPTTEPVDINDAYAGGIHLNPIGQVVIASTWYATLFGRSPVGLDLRPLLEDTGLHLSDEQMHIIQETAWDVVRHHPMTGVSGE